VGHLERASCDPGGAILALVLSMALAGCDGSTAPVEGAFIPVFGQWVTTSMSVVDDTCDLGSNTEDYEPEALELHGLEEGAFQMIFETGCPYFLETLDVTCVLEGYDFACGTQSFSFDASIHEPFTIEYEATISGSFDTATEIVLSIHAATDCTGADCEMFTSYPSYHVYPCAVTKEFTAEADL